jgi:TRAP-type C4-dicarboxylate transport system substrate-binding protein
LDKFNCVYGGAYDCPSYNLMGKKPVRNVNDFKGLRIRCSSDVGIIFKQFGAAPMQVPVTEVYSALDSGVIDLAAFSFLTFNAYKFDEISKYYISDLDISGGSTMYFINKVAWNELPDKLKNVVQSVIDDSPAFMWDFSNLPDRMNEANKVIKQRNIEVIHFPKAERAKLEAKAEAVWDAWAKRSGNYEVAKQALKDYLRIRDEVVAKYPQGVPGIKYK